MGCERARTHNASVILRTCERVRVWSNRDLLITERALLWALHKNILEIHSWTITDKVYWATVQMEMLSCFFFVWVGGGGMLEQKHSASALHTPISYTYSAPLISASVEARARGPI